MKLFAFTTALSLVLLVSSLLHGQAKPPIDSLLKELPRKKEDTNKVKLLAQLATGYAIAAPVKGIEFGQQALDLATQLGWEKGIGDANLSLAANYKAKSDDGKELACLFIALNRYETAQDKAGIIAALGSIGHNYRRNNNLASSLEYFLKALKLAEQSGLKQQVADNADGASEIYYKLGNYSSALEYAFLELKLAEELGNKKGFEHAENAVGRIYVARGDYANASAYLSKALQLAEELKQGVEIGNIATNLGNVYYFQKSYPDAVKYHFKALSIFQQTGDTARLGRAICCVGADYFSIGNFAVAADYFQRALQISETTGDKNDIGGNLCNVGDAYIGMATDPNPTAPKKNIPVPAGFVFSFNPGKPLTAAPKGKAALISAAIDHYGRALGVLRQVNDLNYINNCYKSLRDAYKLKGDYKQAMAYGDSAQAITDSIFNQENTKKVVQQELKYTYGRREDSIKLKNAESAHLSALKLQQQRSYTAVGLVCIVGLLIFSFFAVSSYRTQKGLNATITKLVNEQEDIIRQRTFQLQESNERLENANKKLLELIQYNAHNLREPLTRVMGAMMLQEFVPMEEFYKDIWPQMHKAVNDLDSSIKNVIHIADETVELYK